MTTPAQLDGARLLAWARRGAEELDAHRETINSLNVFPVPDSDTGSNMAYTMAAAVREAEHVEEGAGADTIAEALAVGSIKGARGNSGIVLSQVLRGVAHAATEGQLGGRSIADALGSAVGFVERAINSPVEGTIITVLREAAHAARAAADSDPHLAHVSTAALSAAEDALQRTPSQLAELREAGVVDAGGMGLVLLLAALDAEINGTELAPPAATVSTLSTEASHGATGCLEVLFMFAGPLDRLEGDLADMGTSLVVARVSDTEGKVHIHTAEAGPVIEHAFSLGSVSDLRLEVLPAIADNHMASPEERLIIAVAPPGSVSELYNEAGATTVSPGVDLLADLQRHIESSDAREVIVLPNGQVDEDTLAAISTFADHADVAIVLLPSVHLVAGIAAVAVHDSRLPLDRAAAQMNEAIADMVVADIEHGDPVRIVGAQSTLAEDPDLSTAIVSACRAMMPADGELITVMLSGEDASTLNAAALGKAVGAEVLIHSSDSLPARGHIGVE